MIGEGSGERGASNKDNQKNGEGKQGKKMKMTMQKSRWQDRGTERGKH